MAYDQLATQEDMDAAVAALKANGFEPQVVESGADALAEIKKLIPAGASVMNGSSTTLNQIGYIAFLQAETHGWNNMHAAVLNEQDPAKKLALRKQALLSDYYLGSVHALTCTGELLVASASGSQLPHIAFTSPNLILVISTKKIVPTLQEGITRIEQYVYPLENKRMADAGQGGSIFAKLLVLKKEPGFSKRHVHVILIKENLGF